MTPEKLHDEWCPDWPDCTGGCGFYKDIAAAIRAAVEAEREACALLTEELTKARAAEMGFLHEIQYQHLTGWQAAAAIRARGESA